MRFIVQTNHDTRSGPPAFEFRGLPAGGEAETEALQLMRLAGAVLTKSPDDLAAIAEANPTIVWEWIAAFRQQRLEAEAAARFWSAAGAALATIPEAPIGIVAAE